MQGGSDAILIPSRFEPCGLTQLYGLRYGTLPVVARTGGLADTVIDATPENLKSKQATGIQLSPVSSEQLRNSIRRTCDLYAKQNVWRSMMGNAMRYPVGWERSADEYHDLYRGLAA
jgi:starch synthase